MTIAVLHGDGWRCIPVTITNMYCRLYAGIHFPRSVIDGRIVGNQVSVGSVALNAAHVLSSLLLWSLLLLSCSATRRLYAFCIVILVLLLLLLLLDQLPLWF